MVSHHLVHQVVAEEGAGQISQILNLHHPDVLQFVKVGAEVSLGAALRDRFEEVAALLRDVCKGIRLREPSRHSYLREQLGQSVSHSSPSLSDVLDF